MESIVSFTDQELKDKGVPDEMLRSKNFVKAGTILEGIEEFDAGFFFGSETGCFFVETVFIIRKRYVEARCICLATHLPKNSRQANFAGRISLF